MNALSNFGWVGLGLLAAVGAAGVAIFGKIGLQEIDSTLATTLRSIVMSALLLAVTAATGRLQPLWKGESQIDRRAWFYIFAAGLCGATSWLAYFAALKLGLAAKVAALDKLSVALVFLLGVLVLGDRYSWKGWLGLAFLLAGVYFIAADH